MIKFDLSIDLSKLSLFTFRGLHLLAGPHLPRSSTARAHGYQVEATRWQRQNIGKREENQKSLDGDGDASSAWPCQTDEGKASKDGS